MQRLRFGPGIWAMELRFGPWGWDLGLGSGIRNLGLGLRPLAWSWDLALGLEFVLRGKDTRLIIRDNFFAFPQQSYFDTFHKFHGHVKSELLQKQLQKQFPQQFQHKQIQRGE